MPRASRQNETPSSRPLPALSGPFTFPPDHHLIITTSGGIFSWDSSGIKKLFKSSKKGILAAREARDGSQLLAVADKHTVVLHDCKRGREESWGLEGEEGQVRLLEYAPDAKSLFLSTSLTGAIQCYSINESRLLDPASTHPSPPTVLAVSPSSHLMISASGNPPVVFLQNLTLNTPAMQIHPSASDRAVVAASFHPERPNIFMLAFKDGTLAAYDATKMARRMGIRVNGADSLSTHRCAGEIAHFKKLHRITNIPQMNDFQESAQMTAIGSKSAGITGTAFLPGYRTRAISVGADGKCRIVDFESGGRILRTWHAQAPVTSLSVLAITEKGMPKDTLQGKALESRTKPTAIGGPTSTNSIIAVGRVDGQVFLFDSLGLKLDDLVVNELGEKIINVEWMKGQSPNSMPTETMPSSIAKNCNGMQSPVVPWTGQENTFGLPKALKLPPGAVFQKPSEPAMAVTVTVTDEFATVRHTPVTGGGSFHPPSEVNYLDLFSPVKHTKPSIRQSPGSPDLSPLNPRRPRISSQTFVEGETPDSTPKVRKQDSLETPRQISLHPLGISLKSDNKSGSPFSGPTLVSGHRRSPLKHSAKKLHKRTLGKTISSTGSSLARRNGQVLADLRRLGAGSANQETKSTNRALFAPYMNRTGVSNLPRTTILKHSVHGRMTEPQEQNPDEQNTTSFLDRAEVHFSSESHSSDRDLWLTAGSSDNETAHWEKKRQRRFREKHLRSRPVEKKPQASERPTPCEPKYQVSRFSPESEDVTVISPKPCSEGKKAEVLSMSDEAMFSAASHFSPMDGSFIPSSKDVRKLFPRSKSLSPTASPQKSAKKSPGKQVQIWTDGISKNNNAKEEPTPSSNSDDRTSLAELQPNAVQAVRRATLRHEAAKQAAFALLGPKQANRSKALPALPPPSPSDDLEVQTTTAAVDAMSHDKDCTARHCTGCAARDAQVRDLQDEVARLKAEVLSLRMRVRTGAVAGGIGRNDRDGDTEQRVGGVGRAKRAVPARPLVQRRRV